MTQTTSVKPLGHRSYGSIPHLPGSRRGPGDHGVNEGQARICCVQARDRHDLIIVQEKLDGSNVAVYRDGDDLIPLTRAGYHAGTSPYAQHHMFADWVAEPDQRRRFSSVLESGERLCGEWLAQAHGTRYDLANREPFVPFDLMRGQVRATHDELTAVIGTIFFLPYVLHAGGPCAVTDALYMLGTHGLYGALDPVEGAVWRVERKGKVDFMAKYVKPSKVDGAYLPDVPNSISAVEVWNWRPSIAAARAEGETR
jgi:hypothetical protein